MSPIAIDVHVHPMSEEGMKLFGSGRREAMSRYFGRDLQPVSIPELADQYRARDMMAVLLGGDDSTTSGLPPISNVHIAQAVRDHPDVFVGFGGVDPWKGRLAVDEARRAAEELGLRGLKFNPGRQHFDPSDPRFRPLWSAAQDLGLVCLFHSGMMGAGTPGGMGFKLRYANPLLLDDVAADFPELRLISAHPGWPWQDEQLAVVRHKANVWMDLSGWVPRYFPAQLVQHVNSLIQDKALFGSDWPVIDPDRWLREFDQLDIKPSVRPKVLLENARRLLKLDVQ